MTRYFLTGLISVFFAFNQIVAQTTTAGPDFITNTTSRFQKLMAIPYEKLYLQLDKPYYSAGENIWYSGYLVKGMTTQWSPYSQFIYVELINKGDSVLSRYKIRKDSLGFVGNVPLSASLAPGNYRLRAYSWWMQNSGSDYFFQKNIRIGNAIDKSIQSTVSYKQISNQQVNADIAFTSDENISFTGRKVNYKIYKGDKVLHSRTASIDAQGHLRLGIECDPESNDRYSIGVTFDDPSYAFFRTFFVPIAKPGFDIQFFPEGGNLLNNGIRNVAFKAIGKNGLSVEVEGTVYNQNGDSITSFKSQHNGMGTFPLYLYDTAPVKYSAKVHVIGSTSKVTFNLPEVKNSGVGVNLFVHKDKIFYNIISADKVQSATKKMYLLVQQRGNLQTVIQVSDTLQWNGTMKTGMLLPGIIHFMLLDENGNALSERIAFISSSPQNSVLIKPDKNSYTQRSPVKLNVSFQNPADTSAIGKFSIAVTDDKTVKTDSLADNIYSALLLTSDLKGYIEDPGFYFNTNNHMPDPSIDLVMLTHGWTRFDVPSVVKGKFPEEKHYLEQGQSISGKIKGFFGGSAKKAQLIVLEPKTKLFRTITADEKGQFVVDKLSFPDTATFIVQALSKRGHASVELQMDKDIYPEAKSMNPFPVAPVNLFMTDYLNTMSQKFHYEGGERVVHLKEITVMANKKVAQTSRNPIYEGLGHPITAETIARKYPGRSVMDIIISYPGVRVIGDQILLDSKSRDTPELVIDDFTYHAEFEDIASMLSSINAEEVSYINIIKGVDASMFMGGGRNGAIVIELKQGVGYIPSRPSLGLAIVRPIGYYKPSQFYSPKYITQEQINNPNPDLRTTIYWNPSILLNGNKTSTLPFYTADRSGTYTVTLEGITSAGDPLRSQTKINIK
jgi:Large extracellular alpha-helical protein